MDLDVSADEFDALRGPEGVSLAKPEGAQMALMESLRRPRKSFRKHTYRRQAEIVRPDGTVLKPEDLPSLRVNHASVGRRADRIEVDEVKSLLFQRLAPSASSASTALPLASATAGAAASLPSGGGGGGASAGAAASGIDAMVAKRKERHDAAVLAWHEQQREFYDAAEDRALEGSRALRTDLGSIETRIDALLAEAERPETLATVEHDFVTDRWHTVADLEHDRRARIDAFHRFLDGLEDERVATLGGKLKDLVATLVDVGYQLPPVIERLVERESLDVNRIIIQNRRDAADLAARLEADAVQAYAANRARWEAAEQLWRRVRHDNALREFTRLVDDPYFTNPAPRADVVRALRAAQRKRHAERRLPLLRELGALRPPALTEATVAALREKLEAVGTDEVRDNAAHFARLTATQAAAMDELRARREDLRVQLHRFAALAPEGNLPSLAQRLQDEVLGDETLAPLLRRASGLRAELAWLRERLASPSVFYPEPLREARFRAELLTSALGLRVLLEPQGKNADREALVATVDQMRTAKRTDLPLVVAKLHVQVLTLAAADGLPDLLAEELRQCAQALEDAAEEIAAGLQGAGLEVPSAIQRMLAGEHVPDALATAGSGSGGAGGGGVGGSGASVVHSRRSFQRSSVAGGSAADKSQARARSRSRTRSITSGGHGGAGAGAGTGQLPRTSSRASMSSFADQHSAVLGQVLPMAEIRTLQRRVGALVAACELPDDGKTLLREVLESLERQTHANAAVDAVVREAIEPCVARRVADGEALLHRIGLSLERQAASLAEAGERLCAFVRSVARSLTKFQAREKAVDEWAADEINGALDDFDEANDANEAAFHAHNKLVREAPDEDQLATRFTTLLRDLDAIERSYRDHHARTMAVTDDHPVRALRSLRQHRARLLFHFALVLPDAHRIDGLSPEQARALKEEEDAAVAAAAAAEAAARAQQQEAEAKAKAEAEAAAAASPTKGGKAPGKAAAGASAAAAAAGGGGAAKPAGAKAGAAVAAAATSSGGAAASAAAAVGGGGSTEAVPASDSSASSSSASSSAEGPPLFVVPKVVPSIQEVLQIVAAVRDGANPQDAHGGVLDVDDAVLMGEPEPDPKLTPSTSSLPLPSLEVLEQLPLVRVDQRGVVADVEPAPPSSGTARPGSRLGTARSTARTRISTTGPAGAGAGVAPTAAEYRALASVTSLARALVEIKGETEAERLAREAQEKDDAARAALEQDAAAARQAAEEAAKKKADDEAAAAATAAASAGGGSKAGAKAGAGGAGSKSPRGGKKKTAAELAAEAAEEERRRAEEEEAARRAAEEEARAREEAERERQRQEAAEAEQRRLYPHGLEDAFGVPLDPMGAPCVERVVVPVEEAEGWLRGLRDALLGSFERDAAQRRREVAEEREARSVRFTEELEERLRRHWPRRGVAEVEVRQPRERELIAHQQKLDRHIRGWQDKAQVQQTEFDALVTEARAHVVSALEKLEAFRAQLPSQTSIAALQGVQQRVKQLQQVFRGEVDLRRAQLQEFLAAHPQRLVAANLDFLRTCVLFAAEGGGGGDYDAEELDAVMRELRGLEDALDEIVRRRTALVASVTEQQEHANEPFAAFHDAFEEALRELSMREGLGKKFGAPRRRCQERVRSLFAWSEADAQAVDDKLAELERLVDEGEGKDSGDGSPLEGSGTKGGGSGSPLSSSSSSMAVGGGRAGGGTVSFAGDAARDQDTADTLVARIQTVLCDLRDLLLHRARHLDAFKPDARAFDATPLASLLSAVVLVDQRGHGGGAGGGGGSLGPSPVSSPAPSPRSSTPSSSSSSGGGKGGAAPSSAPSTPAKGPGASSIASTPATPTSVVGTTVGGVRVSTDPTKTFLGGIEEALAGCQQETKDLFAAEGRPILSDADLPESLGVYLTAQRDRAVSARLDMIRALRDQVDRLQDLLLVAPAVALEDLASRALRLVDDEETALKRRLRAQLRALEEVRVKHEADLVPQLADPNAADDLARLAAAEAQRIADHKAALARCRRAILQTRTQRAKEFSDRLIAASRVLLRLADATLLREDLAPLPGDEALPPKKASLKRLRKQLRRDEIEEQQRIAEEAAAAERAAALSAASGGDGKGKGGGGAAKAADAKAAGGGAAKGGAGGGGGASSAAGGSGSSASAAGDAAAAAAAAGAECWLDLAGEIGMLATSGRGLETDGAGVPTRVFKRRRWEGLLPTPEEVLVIPDEPEWARKAAPVEAPATSAPPTPATATPATAAPASTRGGKGGAATSSAPGKGAAAPVTATTVVAEPIIPAVPVPAGRLTSRYSSCARHTVRTRDALYETYVSVFRRAVAAANDRFAQLHGDVERWEEHWVALVEALRAQATRAVAGPDALRRAAEAAAAEAAAREAAEAAEVAAREAAAREAASPPASARGKPKKTGK